MSDEPISPPGASLSAGDGTARGRRGRVARVPVVPVPVMPAPAAAGDTALAAVAAAEGQALAVGDVATRAAADVAARVEEVAEVAAPPEPAPEPEPSGEAAPAAAVADAQPPIIHPEGTTAMATIETAATPAAADKVQSLFGDFSVRMKTMMEKNGKFGEELVELTKGNVEAMVSSARVAARGSETLSQEAADYGRKSLESMMAMLKSYAAVKSPTELFQLQSDYARASFDSAVAEASKLSESMIKLAGEVAQPLSSRYAVAADKLKAAAL